MRPKAEILRLLSDGEKTGLEMVKASRILRLGTVYVHLDEMHDYGLVRTRLDAEWRCHYSLTDAGMRASDANAKAVT